MKIVDLIKTCEFPVLQDLRTDRPQALLSAKLQRGEYFGKNKDKTLILPEFEFNKRANVYLSECENWAIWDAVKQPFIFFEALELRLPSELEGDLEQRIYHIEDMLQNYSSELDSDLQRSVFLQLQALFWNGPSSDELRFYLRGVSAGARLALDREENVD